MIIIRLSPFCLKDEMSFCIVELCKCTIKTMKKEKTGSKRRR